VTVQSLSGRVALVTGSGQRLGRAIAKGLASLGADVAVHCHASREGAEALATEIRADGNRAHVVQCDLTDEKTFPGMLDDIQKNLGVVSVLVNSSARYERFSFLDTPIEALDTQWMLNVRTPYILSQQMVRGLRAAKLSGDIVNILDIGGTAQVWRHYSAYTLTKSALATLTKSLALELAPDVRVNGVAPGTVLPPTELGPEVVKSLREKIPQKRFGSPQDVVDAVKFLVAGPTFITGQIINVDGGRSLSGG
jgi:pteridine reductase